MVRIFGSTILCKKDHKTISGREDLYEEIFNPIVHRSLLEAKDRASLLKESLAQELRNLAMKLGRLPKWRELFDKRYDCHGLKIYTKAFGKKWSGILQEVFYVSKGAIWNRRWVSWQPTKSLLAASV